MTLTELATLPDATIGFGQRIEERDGQQVRIPVMEGVVGAMWQDEHDVMAIEDEDGHVWQTGWIDGVHYKRRMHQYESLEARLKP
jgi:hypothetical protein